MGIEFCNPGCTVIGSPTKVVDLGETHVPKDVFMDYLFELSSEYLPEKYDLLEHNCNNFTNDVSQFLTGKPIPSYITGLPKEILDTPFGAQMRPLLDVMSGPNGGTPLTQQSADKPTKMP
ncbi:Desumoylating isopeptidase 1 [Geodia barretti]|nr:Desumoylating isopeptidase 1 [Geodia barretti]